MPTKKPQKEGLSHALFDVVCWADEDLNAVMPNTWCFGLDEALPDLIILPPAMGEQPPSAISVAMKQWLLKLNAQNNLWIKESKPYLFVAPYLASLFTLCWKV